MECFQSGFVASLGSGRVGLAIWLHKCVTLGKSLHFMELPSISLPVLGAQNRTECAGLWTRGSELSMVSGWPAHGLAETGWTPSKIQSDIEVGCSAHTNGLGTHFLLT